MANSYDPNLTWQQPQQFPPTQPIQQQQANRPVAPNLTVLTSLLKSGQISVEQFNTFAQNAGISNPQLQQQQQIVQQQQMMQLQLQQQQQMQGRSSSPNLSNPLAAFAHLPPIPAAAFQSHFNALGLARNMQQKMIVLGNSLQSGYLGGAASVGGIPMTPEQREAVTRELTETRRASAQIVAQCQAFVAQHGGPDRINGEIALIQARRRLAPPTGQQQQQPQSSPSLQNQSLPNMQQQAQLVAAARNKAMILQQQQQSALQQSQLQELGGNRNGFGELPPGGGISTQGSSPMGMGVGPSGAPPPPPPLHLLQTKLRPDVFMKSLFDVMRKRGQPITGTPYIEGKEVDLYQLYQAVMLNGGSEKTNMQQSWHLIAKQLEWEVDLVNPLLDLETINLSRQLAELYQQLLNPFEMVWEKALSKQQAQIREKEREAALLAQAQQAGYSGNQNQNQNFSRNGRRGSGLGTGWPQNQGGLNGNIQGVGGVGGMAGPSVALQQSMSMESIPLPPNPFTLQQPPVLRPTSSQANNNGIGLTLNSVGGDPNGNVGSSLRPGTIAPSMEQMAEARVVVEELRRNVDATRPKLKLVAVPEDQKIALTAKTHELTPLVKKVYEILPTFVAMSNHRDSARRILLLGGMFQDQLNHISRGEFTLGLSDLAKLMDQMQRCWAFVKQTRATAAAQQAQLSQSILDPNIRSMDHRSPSDPFSLMAQKNTGLRVEDLKPPPVKQRRISNGQSPSGISPATGQLELDSPPKESQQKLKGKGSRAKNGKEKEIKEEVVVDEMSVSLKRKRELEELRVDPDAFIEKTLKAMSRSSLPHSNLLPNSSFHEHSSYSNQIPTIIDQYSQPLSFVNSNSTMVSLPPPTPTQRPLDFDFFIDSTAAGYDDESITAPTPDLITNAEPSPSSDDELESNTLKLNTNANSMNTMNSFGPMTGSGNSNGEVEDFEKWLNTGADLPNTFDWTNSSDELPAGHWELY